MPHLRDAGRAMTIGVGRLIGALVIKILYMKYFSSIWVRITLGLALVL